MTWFSRAPRPSAAPDAPLRLDVAVLTDRGRVREQNEDTGRSVRPGDRATRQAKGTLVLVADGMGGHVGGAVASTTAADAVARSYYETDAPPADALRAALLDANRAIYDAAHRDGLRGMGTTCTALVLRESPPGEQAGEAVMAHVGDSRLYLCRAGRLHRLTEDHSVVAELVRRGFLTPEEARSHEHRHVITRALGTHAEVEVARWPRPLRLESGDVFVLASDGLHDLVEDDEIGPAVADADAYAAATRLIALATERGGYDNITVGVVRVLPAAPSREQPTHATRALPTLS